MGLVTTEAIVLRSYNLAEADRIVVCLTRQAGLVRAVARGARRMKSRFGASLEPFSFVNLVFYERENRELVTVSQVELLKSHFDLAAQSEAPDALAYIAELVCEFAPPHEANDKLYRMLKACVEALANAPNRTSELIRYFEVWLLRLAGLFPEIDACVECERRFRQDENVDLDIEGRPRCRSCSSGYGTSLAATTREYVNATKRLGPERLIGKSSQPSVEVQAELAELTHRLLVRTLERRPRTIVAVAK